MRQKQTTKIATYALIAILLIAGAYALLRPPVPKPLPPPEPIEGTPQFDTAKYRTEPVVSVWIAERGQIASMPLEKYLEGVIAKEMQPDWPLEALAAQAIASRTLTISAMEAGTIKKLHNTDVSTAKEELQAYAPEKVNDAVREAVRKTRGQVLLYAGSLVNAIYSSCNGQVSATKDESFPEEIKVAAPYFQPVTDNCFQYAPEPLQSWMVKIPAAEVASAVGYKGNPADIKILEKGPSGRILYIGAGDKKVYGAEFRKRVGFDRLKSTLITEMTYNNGSFTFKGSGWGNGVGLCQWGAYTFAQQGMPAAEILKHYYVGTEIRKLWD